MYKNIKAIKTALDKLGYSFISSSDEMLLAKNDLVFVRILEHETASEFEFGVRECFDRWANSVDFYYSGSVEQEDLALKIIACVEEQVKEDNFDTGLGQRVDLLSLL